MSTTKQDLGWPRLRVLGQDGKVVGIFPLAFGLENGLSARDVEDLGRPTGAWAIEPRQGPYYRFERYSREDSIRDAADDLLAALVALRASVASRGQIRGQVPGVIRTVDAAIAKAEGRS